MKISNYKETMQQELHSAILYRDLFVEFLATFLLVSVQAALPLKWGSTDLGNVVQVSLAALADVCTRVPTCQRLQLHY